MKLANKPVHPVPEVTADFRQGLTLREHYAGLAMQGMLADPSIDMGSWECAAVSVSFADALIAELEKSA